MSENASPLWDLLNNADFENKTEAEILDAASKIIEDDFYDYFVQEELSRNASVPAEFPITYRIVATIIHVLIFIIGLLGNVLLVIATYRSKRLHTPTSYYLVSLSCADLVVITTAIPEAIIAHHVGKQWLLGSVECSLFIFLNFVGINAGSASILTFTIERYIAVCRPLLAYRVCTLRRTRTLIATSWVLIICYCAPWLLFIGSDRLWLAHLITKDRLTLRDLAFPPFLSFDLLSKDHIRVGKVFLLGKAKTLFYSDVFVFPEPLMNVLTEVRADETHPERKQCHFRMSRYYYQPLFLMDFLFFYVLPFVTALIVYVKIALVLKQRRRPLHSSLKSCRTHTESSCAKLSIPSGAEQTSRGRESSGFYYSTTSKVPRMLMVVVVSFAVSWLPFRLILVYNSFVTESWLNIWYLLFAKTLIYLNCAVNPIVYNVMSHRFRTAVRKIIFCQPEATDAENLRRISEASSRQYSRSASPVAPHRLYVTPPTPAGSGKKLGLGKSLSLPSAYSCSTGTTNASGLTSVTPMYDPVPLEFDERLEFTMECGSHHELE